ncbi:MAG: fumarylacetoacetate hydrolase family protein [Planctomycetes bacterium]|nr:fumarylacetoacetate hydrolase family protein [Planctomycetota bacterium]
MEGDEFSEADLDLDLAPEERGGAVRFHRRVEGDLIHEGKLLLQRGDDFYDLTEFRWRREMPVHLRALCARGMLEEEALVALLGDSDLPRARPLAAEDELLSPILPREVGKVLALGKNFREHAAEFGEAPPEEPIFFTKLPETIVGPEAVVSPPPRYTGRMDHEVELAVFLARPAQALSPKDVMACVGGYTIANDLTLRSMQGLDRKRGHPWLRSKNFPGALPLGPCFAPARELDPANLELRAYVNGELRQQANTRDMLVSVPEALSYLSHHLPLFPGDLVLMGTPAGVGPLEHGDVVTCTIDGLGELVTRIRRP